MSLAKELLEQLEILEWQKSDKSQIVKDAIEDVKKHLKAGKSPKEIVGMLHPDIPIAIRKMIAHSTSKKGK